MIDVLVVVAVAVYVIGRQLIGEPLRGKRVVVLPAVLAVVGASRLHGHGHAVGAADVVLLAAGGAVAVAIGLAQGAVLRLSERDGRLWGQLPPRGLWLWAALIASRLLTTALAHACGAHVAASSAPIILMLGLNRLGQAAVIARRAYVAGIAFAPEPDGSVFALDRLGGAGDRFGTGPGTGFHTGSDARAGTGFGVGLGAGFGAGSGARLPYGVRERRAGRGRRGGFLR
ncbi:hypothetical protein VSR01_18505 [Actinacidiphila sp. DG2A-62]|uniref:hypothetical protein n=1 Tax=Actinacidiphila sp. DG2A-62 TaxID=3108821 RepID=UPI002DB75A18|nr:hypothetical protein [Actinacidiphila sp. DG2A-62]MEC3995415.1 hypothetical protein [Actinacidiphila sp. DG2A-62]